MGWWWENLVKNGEKRGKIDTLYRQKVHFDGEKENCVTLFT
jgi:hypothetical protein